MSESRQQRRARERAEKKAATRPGPNPRPSPPRDPIVEQQQATGALIQVEWIPEYGPTDPGIWNLKFYQVSESFDPDQDEDDEFSVVEVQDMDEDLQAVVTRVVEWIGTSWIKTASMRLFWRLDDDAEDEVREGNIVLPDSLRLGGDGVPEDQRITGHD